MEVEIIKRNWNLVQRNVRPFDAINTGKEQLWLWPVMAVVCARLGAEEISFLPAFRYH